MNIRKFDLTPDPNVLIALTRTPMTQMDALCELVDNAIDSFSAAKKQGVTITNPTIRIFLPKISEIAEGRGVVRILDNGPGLTPEMAEKALKAGYSSNNQFDTLGLFGMGFNISTGKMGSITTLITAREDYPSAVKVVIDLNRINKEKSYEVEPVEIEKEFEHGTMIEISEWWPEGNPNNGFIKRLAQLSVKKIREQLGRRYATILRGSEISIQVNDIPCEPYQFCVWSEKRFVKRQKYGEIPAQYTFNEVVYHQKKCMKCGAVLEEFQSSCPSCGCGEIRSVEEKISGWVGIQRYDSLTEFGIDLIRNGRAIRVSEKSAFFEYTNELGETIKDYPIDTNYGRIVGEVHLDHVPVDFQKQDFQRSSPEWQRAMTFLRGNSSLQPKQPGAEQNASPIFKLYQGYRKVKTAGKTDLYMGYWDSVKNEPHRISREKEKEFIDKFRAGDPDYLDDTKWWAEVEAADHEPVKPLPTCPQCGVQILESAEICSACGKVLKGKKCIKCEEIIPQSAKICPKCNTAQEAEILQPWKCEVCHKSNLPTLTECAYCGSPKGAQNTLSVEYLKEHANLSDELSIPQCIVEMADGSESAPLKVNVYITNREITSSLSHERLPIFTNKDSLDELTIFVDVQHEIFKDCQVIPEQIIATEIADRISVLNRSGNDVEGLNTISILTWKIILKYWIDNLGESTESTAESIATLMKNIKQRLAMTVGTESSEIFESLSDRQSKALAMNVIGAGESIDEIGEMKHNGMFLQYVGDDFILNVFKYKPALFFDGNVWNENYEKISAPDELKKIAQVNLQSMYGLCLEDIITFPKLKTKDALFIKRIMCSTKFLYQKVNTDVY